MTRDDRIERLRRALPAREFELAENPNAVVQTITAALGERGFRLRATGAEGEFIFQIGSLLSAFISGGFGFAAGPFGRTGTVVLCVSPTARGSLVQLALVHGGNTSSLVCAMTDALLADWAAAGLVVPSSGQIASQELPASSPANADTFRRRRAAGLTAFLA